MEAKPRDWQSGSLALMQDRPSAHVPQSVWKASNNMSAVGGTAEKDALH